MLQIIMRTPTHVRSMSLSEYLDHRRLAIFVLAHAGGLNDRQYEVRASSPPEYEVYLNHLEDLGIPAQTTNEPGQAT
jgi:hypothetical protein